MNRAMDNFVNLFWAIVWGVVLAGVVGGMFWRPALYIVALLAAFMLGAFLKDYIYVKRMK